MPGPVGSFALELFRTALGREYPMTKLYIGLQVAIFIFMTLRGAQALLEDPTNLLLGANYVEAARWGATAGFYGRVEPFRYLSAVFVHFGALHIGMNMMALLSLGRSIEPRIGSGRFVLAFLGTGVVGFVVSDYWSLYTRSLAWTAGASGGLFGLVGVLLGFLVARRDPAWREFLFRIVLIGVVLGVMLPVNNAAHAGGFIVGFPTGYLFQRESRPWRRTRWFDGLAVLLVAASVGSIVLSHSSNLWRTVDPVTGRTVALLPRHR